MAAGARPVAHADGALVLNGQRIRLTHEKTIEALPLAELGVDLVIDCTGVFKTAAKVAPYYAAGVKKVVVSAPVKDGGALNLVYGVNHHLYDGAQASCHGGLLHDQLPRPGGEGHPRKHRHPPRLDHHDP